MRDDCFIRGNVPMTKSEIRAISISKLELKPDWVVYDIGAGTGSVSVEMAFQVPCGQVYAIEQKAEACNLIVQNQELFHCRNLSLIQGKAPECLESLPAPNAVFIGGSGGGLEQILDTIHQKNKEVRIVMNTITIETQMQVMRYLKERELQAETIMVQISHYAPLGRYHYMESQNPITITTINSNQQSI